jgi:capsular polysaccharide biosynthesis protein
MNLSLGIFLAFIGGPAFAFFLEYIRDTVERPEDIENYLKTPVLTSIPEHK